MVGGVKVIVDSIVKVVLGCIKRKIIGGAMHMAPPSLRLCAHIHTHVRNYTDWICEGSYTRNYNLI